jgi:hypothetical protein
MPPKSAPPSGEGPPPAQASGSNQGAGDRGGGFVTHSLSADVFSLVFPRSGPPPRISVPKPIGCASDFQVRVWLRRVFEAVDRLSPGCLHDATGQFGLNLLDTFLMFLGHNGTTEKISADKKELDFASVNGDIAVPVSLFYDAMTEVTPRQLGRSFANRLGELAVEFNVVYQWGKNHGIRAQDARVSHDCADYMSALTRDEKEIIAKAKTEALVLTPEVSLLDPTSNQVLLQQQQQHQAPVGLLEIQRRFLALTHNSQ